MKEYLPSRHTEHKYICNISAALIFHRESNRVQGTQESYLGEAIKDGEMFLGDSKILRVLACRFYRFMSEGCSVDWYLPKSVMLESKSGEA